MAGAWPGYKVSNASGKVCMRKKLKEGMTLALSHPQSIVQMKDI